MLSEYIWTQLPWLVVVAAVIVGGAAFVFVLSTLISWSNCEPRAHSSFSMASSSPSCESADDSQKKNTQTYISLEETKPDGKRARKNPNTVGWALFQPHAVLNRCSQQEPVTGRSSTTSSRISFIKPKQNNEPKRRGGVRER